MSRKRLGFASFILLVLAIATHYSMIAFTDITSGTGSIIDLVLFSSAFILAIFGKGKWRIVPLIFVSGLLLFSIFIMFSHFMGFF